jgi:hypothetical protein
MRPPPLETARGPVSRPGTMSVILAIAGLIVGACSSNSRSTNQGSGGGEASCAFVAVWRGVTYTDVLYRYQTQHLTSDDIRRPAKPGRFLGMGKVPRCGGEASAGAVRIYTVPGVSTRLAVMTADKQLGIAKGSSIPHELIGSAADSSAPS